jgi:hypothetical protein
MADDSRIYVHVSEKEMDAMDFVIDTFDTMKRKSLASVILVPVFIGSIGLMHLTHQPEFASFRSVDVLQLLGSGMCFGVALSGVFAMLRGTRAD